MTWKDFVKDQIYFILFMLALFAMAPFMEEIVELTNEIHPILEWAIVAVFAALILIVGKFVRRKW